MQADFLDSEKEQRKLSRDSSQSVKQHLTILALEPCSQIQRAKQGDCTLSFHGKMAQSENNYTFGRR